MVARVSTETGVELWSQQLDPAAPGASAIAIATDSARNVIVAGRYESRGGDVVIQKFRAADGDTLLWKRWDGPAHQEDRAEALMVDGGGNIYVAGCTTGGGHTSGLLLKYSPKGKLLWKYILSSSVGAQFKAVGRDGSGNVYVTGTTNINSSESRLVTLKISPAGRKVWQRTIAGLGVSYGGQFLKVKGSAVYVVGWLDVDGGRPVILKYGLTGKSLWKHASGTTAWVNDMTVDPKGRVILVGWRYSDAWVPQMKVGFLEYWTPSGTGDPGGAMFPADFGPGAVYPAEFDSVITDATGRIFCAGSINTAAEWGTTNAVVVTWPSIDSQVPGPDAIWRYDGPASGYDMFYGMLRTSDGAIYVAGRRAGPEGAQAILHRLAPALPPG